MTDREEPAPAENQVPEQEIQETSQILEKVPEAETQEPEQPKKPEQPKESEPPKESEQPKKPEPPKEPVYKSPREYEGKTLMVDGYQEKIPQFSKWRRVFSCCGGKFNIVYFPAIRQYFINQWECRPTYPAFVSISVTFGFACGLWSIFDFQKDVSKIILAVLLSLTYFIWVTSYFCAVCRSPGYVPWYWAVEKKEVFTFEEQMDGVVTTEEQFNFAARNARPERGTFSRQARRLVLKADHICKWIANWVGLKNYRYFYLKVVWAIVYFLMWFVVFIMNCVEMRNGWVTKASFICCLVCFLPMFGFCGFLFVMIARHAKYTCHNDSTLQEFRRKEDEDKHNYYDLGCWQNYVEIFGPAKYCPCWFFPVPIKRQWGGYHWKTNKPRPDDIETA